MSEQMPDHARRPEVPAPNLNDPEYVAFATLGNDLTGSNTTDQYIPFTVRLVMAQEMWAMGYRPTQERVTAGIERQRASRSAAPSEGGES